jgi:hypothetical protein
MTEQKATKKLAVVESGFYGGFACLLVVNCGEVVVFCVVKLVRKQSLFGVWATLAG